MDETSLPDLSICYHRCMNAILVPGRPDKDQHYDPTSASNGEDHWFSWLKRQLILRDIHAVSIEPPFPFRPRYNEWQKEFERFDITPDTILVGHSCGAGFLVRWLSEHKDVQVAKVVLVAPWLDPLHYKDSDVADFFEFQIDPTFVARTKDTVVFVSGDDDPSVIKTVDILREKVTHITAREFMGKGHFTRGALGKEEFPELLDELAL